ncbi:MAG: HAD family hydrolase [Alphaproteobacteria bacterium]
MKKQTLIVDCDGVLYPKESLQLQEFVSAMNETVLKFGISKENYEKISSETKDQKPGMYNFIYALCDSNDKKYADFCQEMTQKVDYSRIERDEPLFELLKSMNDGKNFDVVILTNNTRPHLEKVFDKLFDRSVEEFEYESGVMCYDITDMKYGDLFYPKQSQIGLKLFSQQISKKPQECILVDDTSRNLEAAKNVGMGAVLINSELPLHKYLKSLSKSNNISLNRNKSRY